MLKKLVFRLVKQYMEKELSGHIKSYMDHHYKVCETSKALVPSSAAVEGESEVREENNYFFSCGYWGSGKGKVIYTPYYSPAFAPKKKEEKKVS